MTTQDGIPCTLLSSIAYDPAKVVVTFDGERIIGFSSDMKISLSRRLNGVAEAKVYLNATSKWVTTFKDMLGHHGSLDVEYKADLYKDAMSFRAKMYVAGYEVDINKDVPTFIFYLKTRDDEQLKSKGASKQ